MKRRLVLCGMAAALAALAGLIWRVAVPWVGEVFIDGKLNRAKSEIHGVIVAVAGIYHLTEGDYGGISIWKLAERGDIPLGFIDGAGENAYGGDIGIAMVDGGGAEIINVFRDDSRGAADCARAALRFSGYGRVADAACGGEVLEIVLE